MAPRSRGQGKVVPARAVVTKTPAPLEPAPLHSGRKGLSVLASLGIAGLLLVFTAQVAVAAIFGRTTNGTNTVTALTLVSPTAPAGVYTPSKVVLTWTAASPMNGNGYIIRAFNNGASGVCPTTVASYVTLVGSTAAVTLTDVGVIAQGAPGTFACYLIQTGYRAAGGPPWVAVPQWTSTAAVANIASVKLGVALVQKGVKTALSAGNVVTPTLPAVSTAGTLLVAVVNANASGTQSTPPAGWNPAPAGAVNQPGCCRSEIWYYSNNPGGINSASFTLAAGNQGIAQLTEWKGVSTLDKSGTKAVGVATNSVTLSTAGATSVANELAITGVESNGAAGSVYTPGAGWTVPNLFTDNPNGDYSDYRVNLPAAVASETFTDTNNFQWSAIIATFK